MRALPANRYAIFFSLVILGCLADLATKSWAFSRLDINWPGIPLASEPHWVIDDLFGFQTSLNQGALFGMGQGLVAVFAILSVLAAVGVFLWLFVAGAAEELLLTVALGSITAGIFGNLYDRLGLHGLRWPTATQWHDVGDPVHAVRDWIQVMIGTWPWPTFNIADSMLVCGAVLLVWHAFHQKPPQQREAAVEGTVD